MKKSKDLIASEQRGNEEKKEAVVVSTKSIPTNVLKKAVKRVVEEHLETMGPKDQIVISDPDIGEIEVTRSDNYFLFGLLDYGFRMLTYDQNKMAIVSDSSEEATIKMPLKPTTKEEVERVEKIKKAPVASSTKKEVSPAVKKERIIAKEKKPPVMVTQKGYDGKPEEVDKNHYCNKINCSVCGGVRYVANADKFQVTKCKPCQRKKASANLDKMKASKNKAAAKKSEPKKK